MDNSKQASELVAWYYPDEVPPKVILAGEEYRLNRSEMSGRAVALITSQPACPRCAECSDFLKEDETPLQRMQRDHKDTLALLKLFEKEKARCADQKFKLAEYDRAFVEQEQQIASDKLLLDECEEVLQAVRDHHTLPSVQAVLFIKILGVLAKLKNRGA